MHVSLNKKMALAVSFLTTTLLAVMAYSVLAFFEKQIKVIISNQQYTLVSAIADDIEQKVTTVRGELQILAWTASPRVFVSAKAAKAFIDNETNARKTFFSGLYIFDPHGALLSFADGHQWVDTRQGRLQELLEKSTKTRSPLISEPFFLNGDNREPVVMFSAPALDSTGNLKGVLVGSVCLFNENFLGKISTIRLGRQGYLALFNTNRIMVLHKDRNRILAEVAPPGVNSLFDRVVKGFEGTGEMITSKGLHALGSFRRVKTTNWILAATYPLAEAYEPIYRAHNYLLVGLLVAVAISNLIIWCFMQYLTAPLRRFTNHVELIGERSSLISPVAVESHDEIGTLARKFNTMVAELDRRQTTIEEQLSFSRSLLQNAAVPAFVIDLEHRILIWNHACEELTGIQADKVIGTSDHWRGFYEHQRPCLADIVLDGSGERLSEYYRTYGRSQLVSDGLQAEGWFRRNGMDRYIFFSAAPVRAASGNVVAVIETLDDITARKQIEEELCMFSYVVQQSPLCIVITDSQGCIEYVNPKFTEVTGYSEEDVLGKNPAILKSGETTREEYQKLWETILAGREWQGEFHNRKKSGDLYWEQAMIAPIKDSNGFVTHFVSIKEDVTEKKQLENKLRYSQKMEAVGQLAGGVAHDFNNLLTAIIGYASIMEMQGGEEQRVKRCAESIVQAAERGAKLTKGLLAFSRQQAESLTTVSLNDVVGRVKNLLERDADGPFMCDVLLSPELLLIMGDSIQVEQLIMNLVTNAKEAMPDGGKLTIEAGRCIIEQDFIASHGFGQPGVFAVLSVTDTGKGMDNEIIKRMYEPFFSTKEVGQGNGLGLSLVYGVVKRHKGFIICESQPGEGTCFRVYYPLMDNNETFK